MTTIGPGGCAIFLKAFAGEVRTFLEPEWQRWHDEWGPPCPRTPSQWTCIRSSHFLVGALQRVGVEADVHVGWRVGVKAEASALAADRSETHAWVEALDLLVDITADQFGSAPIVVTLRDDLDYRRAKYADTMLPLTPAGRRAIDALWQAWQERQQRTDAQ